MKIKSSVPAALALLLAVTLTIFPSCNPPSGNDTGLQADSLRRADSVMMAYVDEGKLPCVATLILKEGEIVHRLTYGVKTIEGEEPLTEDAIFRIYSMSKPITAAALMMLYDDGEFLLDDPVEKYIPVFEGVMVYEDGELVPQDEPFTIRHLLTHTAGFTYGWGAGYVDSIYRSHSPGIWELENLEKAMEVLAGFPLKHQPGTTYEYSVSIDVAGYLVEVLSGMTFDVFLEERVFGPLGMKDTGFEVPEEDYDRLATIYTPDDSTGVLKPVLQMTEEVKRKVTIFSGGGGLVSTLEDYAKFGQMLLNGGTYQGTRILEQSTVDLIMSDQMPEEVEYDGGYGLGGYVNVETGAYGWSGAASTDFVADPSRNMVILTFTQYTPFMGVPLADVYKEMVRDALTEPQ